MDTSDGGAEATGYAVMGSPAASVENDDAASFCFSSTVEFLFIDVEVPFTAVAVAVVVAAEPLFMVSLKATVTVPPVVKECWYIAPSQKP